jgi:hypothetical protein
MASGDKVSLNRHTCRDSSRSKMTSILLYSAGAQHIGMSDAVGLPTRLTRPLLPELRLSAIDPSETFANGHRAPSPLASTPRSGDEVRLLTYVRPTAHVIVARRLWSPNRWSASRSLLLYQPPPIGSRRLQPPVTSTLSQNEMMKTAAGRLRRMLDDAGPCRTDSRKTPAVDRTAAFILAPNPTRGGARRLRRAARLR